MRVKVTVSNLLICKNCFECDATVKTGLWMSSVWECECTVFAVVHIRGVCPVR